MPQAATKTVTIASVIESAPFRDGWLDGMCDAPFRKDYDKMDKSAQARYERGRMLGVLGTVDKLTVRRRATRQAIEALMEARKDGSLI